MENTHIFIASRTCSLRSFEKSKYTFIFNNQHSNTLLLQLTYSGKVNDL